MSITTYRPKYIWQYVSSIWSGYNPDTTWGAMFRNSSGTNNYNMMLGFDPIAVEPGHYISSMTLRVIFANSQLSPNYGANAVPVRAKFCVGSATLTNSGDNRANPVPTASWGAAEITALSNNRWVANVPLSAPGGNWSAITSGTWAINIIQDDALTSASGRQKGFGKTATAGGETGILNLVVTTTPNNYALTLANGSTSYIASVSGGGSITYNANVSAMAALANAAGYTTAFAKWVSSNAGLLGDSAANPYNFNMPPGSFTLTATATRTANVYTYSFDHNGGSGSTTSIAVTYGQKVPNIIIPTRTGYTFSHYSPDGVGGGAWYWGNTGITTEYMTQTRDITFYANWTANTYTVNFNANGGSVGTAFKTVAYNSTYGVLPTPERVGYEFLGWFTAASGGTQILNTTTVGITSTQTLYAQWEVKGGVRIYTNGAYRLALPYVWVNGNLRQCVPYIRTGGEWRVGI